MTNATMPTVSSEKLNSHCALQKEACMLTMSKVRTMLLSQIGTIKSDATARKQWLHTRIMDVTAKLNDFSMNYSNRSITEVSLTFSHLGKSVGQLRLDVDRAVAAQHILVEAHDIIGASHVLLTSAEVDTFVPMDVLEVSYSLRAKAWKCIVDCGTLKHHLVNSRLTSNSVAEWTKQFNGVFSTHEYLLQNSSGSDEHGTLEHIGGLIRDLLPKIQLVSFLSSKALRARHWKWLGDYAFSCCGLLLKMSGKQSEYISVMDVQSARDPVSMGSVYRLPFNELVYR
jgi:hypothetical protein